MDTSSQAAVPHIYQDFEPSFKWQREKEADTLSAELPDFQKEQLRVQLIGYGKIKLSGERPLGDNKWSRFIKEFPLSAACNTGEIHAKFENNKLTVILPKIVRGTVQQNESKPSTTPTPEVPTTQEPKKAPSTVDEKMIPEKKESSGMAMAAEHGKTDGGKFRLESNKQAVGDLVMGLRKQQSNRGLIVNLVVAGLVVVGLGMYMAYKIRSKEDNKSLVS